MEERHITIDGNNYELKPPFFVIATQNPIEQEGTYALPEAQLDRFLFKIKVGYPNKEEEVSILKTQNARKGAKPETLISPILSETDLLRFQQLIYDVVIDEKILNYIADIIYKTRNHSHLFLGGSPRASLATMHTAKAFAAIQGRDFVIPDDVKTVLPNVLRHRIILNPEYEMEGFDEDAVIKMIVENVEVPR